MDFYQIKEREGAKKDKLDVYPDFKVVRSKDLMVRGKSFYAIWDEEKQLWSTDEFDVQRLVDKDISEYEVQTPGIFEINKKYLGNWSSSSWMQFRNYVSHLSDNSHQLDSKLTFANSDVKKEDYVSKKLPYALAPGDISAWDELVSTLYSSEERAKIEWAIGAIVSGDSTTIQKFLVFYGRPGTGKSTIINIIQKLFEGYWNTFVASELVSSNASFALEAFKTNPLVAIEHDSDLSRIQDNSRLNSLVAHEPMEINEKNKPKYRMQFSAMIIVGSNKPVKITDSRSGLIRRMIDIHPSGKIIPNRKYQTLYSQIDFELGAIAHHCLEVYRKMGKNYYSGYIPIDMMLQTDVFFNFIESYYDVFKENDGVTLKKAYEMYKTFCEKSDIEHRLTLLKFRGEMDSYFEEFHDRITIDNERVRSYYSGFKAERFKTPVGGEDDHMYSLVMDETESIFDTEFAECPAQYSKEDGTPRKYWDDSTRVDANGKEFTPKPSQVVNTILSDIDTSKEHYVKVPENHIVIDFDLEDENGEKSAERNLSAASSWPSTYAEYSKSGKGIHLHYTYEGDPTELSRVYDEGIEIKVFTGNTSLRRRLSKCNKVPIASISSGLPLKEKKVINEDRIKSERALRDLILRNLRKEIHPSTKPSVDFIHKILDDAYKSGLSYNVTDMRSKILAFAANSTNQSLACIKLVQSMQFKSEDEIEAMVNLPKDERLVMFDVEVFPNLFVVCWKYQGASSITKMINPTSSEIEKLLSMKLVGFNCRRYDNHILYGAYMGLDNMGLYKLSQKLIDNNRDAYFGEAYNISYADIYEFAATKMSLKKWEIELGIHHMELGIPWDKPVPEELWDKVVAYCCNDVEATDAVFNHLKADFVAREILADLSGLSINSTTQQHTAKIVFGEERKPQKHFVYTELSEMFPGYTYEFGKSTYRGEEVGEGGLVRAKPGMYENVVLLDVASMHPTSIEELDLFGEYTKNFSQLKKARLAIKRKDYNEAKQMLGGKLARHLKDEEQADALSYALKIVINIVYGLTSAKFDNAFRDPRNIDNIVAKRGALFMMDLMYYMQEKGYEVVHIKTDSIKIPVSPEKEKEMIELVMEFGDKYGYTFEHEETYDKFCLVNNAVYIAKTKKGRKPAQWVATGAQFAHPYVFKYLFSKEKITFEDMCETKSVTTAMYLDFNNTGQDIPMAFADLDDRGMLFIGKTGQFCPILPEAGGGYLMREKDGKFDAVTGTKGFLWLESEMVKTLKKEKDIDSSYFEKLINEAIESISKFGDFEWFVS